MAIGDEDAYTDSRQRTTMTIGNEKTTTTTSRKAV